MMEPLFTPEEFAEELSRIFNTPADAETRHWLMDGVMCNLLASLGYSEGVEIFLNADKNY